jgi:subtilase family serine protease
MRRFLKNLFGGNKAGAARGRQRKPVPLAVESLEARYALSTLTPFQVSHYYGFDRVGFQDSAHAFQLGDGRNTTIAIVDAYDDPNIASDLATFDSNFRLPAAHLTVVNQSGGSTLPTSDPGAGIQGQAGYRAPRTWESETALDVEYAHAMAPGANILLVETNNPTSLYTGVQYAASQPGVVAVSMSWGALNTSGGELNGTGSDSTFSHSGVTFVASTGDNGAPANYPAFSPNVVAVGGTTVNYDPATGYSESGWSGSGGGVSQYETQPSYQAGVVPDSLSTDAQGVKRRTIPDAAFIANSVTIYDTYFGNGYYTAGLAVFPITTGWAERSQ